jgi:hypothetical protein
MNVSILDYFSGSQCSGKGIDMVVVGIEFSQ